MPGGHTGWPAISFKIKARSSSLLFADFGMGHRRIAGTLFITVLASSSAMRDIASSIRVPPATMRCGVAVADHGLNRDAVGEQRGLGAARVASLGEQREGATSRRYGGTGTRTKSGLQIVRNALIRNARFVPRFKKAPQYQ